MSEVPKPPLEKYSPGVREQLLRNLMVDREKDAPKFLRDFADFMRMPIDPVQTPENMLKILATEAKKRMGESKSNGDAAQRSQEDAFVSELGRFLQLCAEGDAIRDNIRTGRHEEVKTTVRGLVARIPTAPTESERENFIERLLNAGYPSGSQEYHRIQKRLEERDKAEQKKRNSTSSARLLKWFRPEPDATPQEVPKEIPPHRVLDELRNTLPAKKQSHLTLKQIQAEANEKHISWQNFDPTKPDRSEVYLVLTADGICLVVDRRNKSFEIDDTKPKK